MGETWQPTKWTRQQLEERRLAALPFLSDESMSNKDVAQRFSVSESTVRSWRRRIRLDGTLEASVSSGRPSFLTDAQIAETIDWIKAGPDPKRFPDGRWTTARVREEIGRRYNVWYNPDWVGKLLWQWNFSWQKAEKRPIERKQEQVDEWLEVELPALEKKDRGWRNSHMG